MKNLMSALRLLLFMTILTGVIYPVSVTLVTQVLFPNQVNGSLIERDGQRVGSKLMGQSFTDPKYFWSRPSATQFKLPSGGSNQSQISADLKKSFDERRVSLMAAHPGKGQPPQDLLFASASGFDPHVSPEAALYQLDRVAIARKFSASQIEQLKVLLKEKTESPQFGVLGQPRVNVLELNLSVDRI